jgi:hypothetical protein
LHKHQHPIAAYQKNSLGHISSPACTWNTTVDLGVHVYNYYNSYSFGNPSTKQMPLSCICYENIGDAINAKMPRQLPQDCHLQDLWYISLSKSHVLMPMLLAHKSGKSKQQESVKKTEYAKKCKVNIVWTMNI